MSPRDLAHRLQIQLSTAKKASRLTIVSLVRSLAFT